MHLNQAAILSIVFTTLIIASNANIDDHNMQVYEITSEFWDWRMVEWPEFASKVGRVEYNDRMEIYTEAAFLQEKIKAEKFLQRLQEIEKSSLTKDNQVNADILKILLVNFIEGYDYRKYSIYNNMAALEHVMYKYNKWLRYMPRETVEDYHNILVRYSGIPTQLQDMIQLMKLAVDAGTTVHTTTVNSTITHVQKELASNMSTFRGVFSSKMLQSKFGVNETAELSQRAQVAVDSIRNTLTEYVKYLREEYYPHARTEPGVGSLPGGDEYYAQCLKWHITTDATPQQVHQKGIDEVERIRKLMKKIMQDNGFNGTLREYIASLKDSPDMFYNTSEQMLTRYRNIVLKTHSQLSKVFHDVNIPQEEVQVLANNQRVSRYSRPSADGSQPGTFWADVEYPRDKPKYGMAALTLHEAEPGHHLFEVGMSKNNQPLFRRYTEFLRYNAVPFNWLFNTASQEGWALYAESLGEEMGLYDPDKLELFGRYSSELYRAARLVVDTGMHYYGWSIEEAENYMLNYTAMGPLTIKNEILRYLSWPGQACAYKIGELKIQELRALAKEKLGSSFDLRDFHREVLALGAVPMTILEQEIKDWIEANQQQMNNMKNLKCNTNYLILATVTAILLYQRLH